MSISGSAKVAGVIGWPVGHSLSPLLHGYWLAQNRIDGAYVPLSAPPADFMTVIDGLRRAGFAGVNVTVPHKEAAFALAHDTDAAAKAAGAANLLVFHSGGRIEARNTDAVGLSRALEDGLGKNALAGKTVVLLGAGGAARGAVVGLDGSNPAAIHILNRDSAKARGLAAALTPLTKAKLTGSGLDDWPDAASGAALAVNATSAGMNGAAPLDLELSHLPETAAVFDMVYKPLQTALLRAAAAQGLKTLDGLGMLMHQAAPSFQAFYGVMPQVDAGLRDCLQQALA